MASCPRVTTCPLFEQFSMKSSAANREVPLGLLPNGRHLDVPLEQLEARHMS